MKSNVGKTDRIIRIIVASICAYIAIVPTTVFANEALRLFIGTFGLLNLISGITAFCPMYSLASLSTRKN